MSDVEDSTANGLRNPSFSSTYPSRETILSICPSHDFSFGQQKGTTATLKGFATAMTIVVRTLRFLAESLLCQSRGSSTPLRNSSSNDWLVETLCRIWSVCSHGHDQYNPSLLPITSLSSYLDAVRILIQSRLKSRKYEGQSVPLQLLQSIATIVVSAPLPIVGSIETTLGLTLIEVASLARSSLRVKSDIVCHILPLLQDTVQNHPRFDAMGMDLKVFSYFV